MSSQAWEQSSFRVWLEFDTSLHILGFLGRSGARKSEGLRGFRAVVVWIQAPK